MKKLLLATAVATLCVSTAQAAPTLYGKLHVSLDQVDNNDYAGNNQTALNSNASRIGVKGDEKLTDNISVVYLAEWSIDTDGSGSDANLGARNRFLGLKFANVGTLKAGKYDSYLKTAAGSNQDIFNDHTVLDMTAVLAGEDRLNNVIGFETDKNLLGGVQFNIMLQQGESSTDSAALGQKGKRDGLGDGISTSVSYDNKDIGLAVALAGNFGIASKYNGVGLSGIFSDAYRLTGSYDFSNAGVKGLVVGGLWQHAEPSDNTVPDYSGLEEDAYSITAAYAIPSTPWKVKAEYVSAETSRDGASDRTIDQYGVGVDYSLNKQTRVYGVLAQQKKDWLASDDKKTVFGLGMEYNF
ncbi:porin [Acinetobacter populi]|jgi:predicted porin|uniref:Porin n=1 Tax=Acinetobacter populi TaxID=1582270 RepID=A0A1Z9YY29_9GAMM|nr:porin [Acinetobacter populi]MCH4247146.1 porin [Acinetobacter populi]OUY07115.1 porin [Acinetobacter populi]